MITLSIDVGKIDKSRFFVRKDGSKWLDLVLIESPTKKFGNDYFVTQSKTKEEIQNKVQLPILGNAKIMPTKGNGPSKPSKPQPAEDW